MRHFYTPFRQISATDSKVHVTNFYRVISRSLTVNEGAILLWLYKKKKKGPSSCPSLMKLPCKLALYDYYLAMKSIFLMFLMVTRYSVQVLVNGGNGVYGGWVLVKGYHCYNSDISMRLNHLLSFSKTKTKTNKHKKRTNHELRGRTYMRVEEDICN